MFRESRRQHTSKGQAEHTSADKGRCIWHIYERNGGTVVVTGTSAGRCAVDDFVYMSHSCSCSQLLPCCTSRMDFDLTCLLLCCRVLMVIRDVPERLSTFPFPPIPIYSIPIPSHPHSQFFFTYSHSHGIPMWAIPIPSHSHSVTAKVVYN